jgi:aminoglycoside phosphotransferase (APT) family kinase protein
MTDTGIEMTADLVRDLLQEQHPDLAGLAIREVAGGWGNQMWRLGDELAVRMQRMDRTPEFQLKERRWLPVLAPVRRTVRAFPQALDRDDVGSRRAA